MRTPESLSASALHDASAIATYQLTCRPRRAANFEGESRALGALCETLSTEPRSVLQKLANVALELCNAHSAGVSLLEDSDDVSVIRWHALAGEFAPRAGTTLPRASSACGMVIDTDTLQLLSQPACHFPSMVSLTPAIEETLTAPIHINHKALGTLWIAAHDNTRQFDAEDARLITSLALFAGAALELLTALDRLEAGHVERRKAENLAAALDRNKDRFIAILAHELRSPLAPIRNAAALLRGMTLDAAATWRTSEIIDRQVNGMTRLIDDLLHVSRLRLGNIDLRRTVVTLNEIVERTIETVGPFARARDHALVLDLPEEPVDLDVDVMWLSQALQNLVRNAVKYTNPGGRIQISAFRDGEQAVFKVSDNGIGIAPAQLDIIFDLWEQAGQSATPRSEGGLGIGLYIARRLVEAHSGTVTAASAGPGRGSEFTVRIPCILLPGKPVG